MGKPIKSLLIAIAFLFLSGCVLYFFFPGFLYQSAVQMIRWWGGLKRCEIRVDGYRWVYLEGGKGDPILFIHGFGADKDRWGTFVTAFSGGYRVVVPDLPGFGESSRIAKVNYTIPAQVKRLNRFVECLGLGRFHLVGISMGGCMAAYYAAEYPGKVKSLALMDPAGVRSRIPSYVQEQYFKKGKISLLYKTPRQFDDMLSVVFHRPPWIPLPLKRYFAGKGAENYALHRKILREMFKDGMGLLESRLQKVRASTLLIWGAEDRVIHVSGVEKFEKGLKNLRTVIIRDCGHVPYIEKAGETIMTYKDFLSSLSS